MIQYKSFYKDSLTNVWHNVCLVGTHTDITTAKVWCDKQPSPNRYYVDYMKWSIFFEHEHDALLFSLWTSGQPKPEQQGQFDLPFFMKKHRLGTPGEFKIMYEGDWDNI